MGKTNEDNTILSPYAIVSKIAAVTLNQSNAVTHELGGKNHLYRNTTFLIFSSVNHFVDKRMALCYAIRLKVPLVVGFDGSKEGLRNSVLPTYEQQRY